MKNENKKSEDMTTAELLERVEALLQKLNEFHADILKSKAEKESK